MILDLRLNEILFWAFVRLLGGGLALLVCGWVIVSWWRTRGGRGGRS